MSKHFPKHRQKTAPDWQTLIEAHSPYLLANRPHWDEACFEGVLKQADKALQKAGNTDSVMQILRQAKLKVATLTAIADLKGEWDDVTVMAKLSAFADFCVQHALRHILQQAKKDKKIRLKDDAQCGVVVLAMGKWGAHELNYSSDIDLMVIFDSQKSPVIDRDETQNFFIRVTRELARILEQSTADGYVFRADLRLRPDPGAMPLAVSLAAAENYYSTLGQNWERAAMIKARPVAGDMSVGQDFMESIARWIWRKNLDFATIQDINSIKRQINAKQKKAGTAFNVKLGHGGIREIEFFAQTQQLIYGGREPQLRVPDTLSALTALAETGHITADKCKKLQAAYLFLRHTEHRLQMQEDRQTHTLPLNVDKFSAFMGYPSAKKFTDELEKHTSAVKELYAGLFTESPSLSQTGNLVFTGVEDDPETLETLRDMGFKHPTKITPAIRGWHHGRYRAVRSERARQILTEMIPHLLKTLSETPHPDDAFTRFDQFLEKLPAGIPIFSMFLHNPQQMELVAEIMGTAPAMAEHLGTRPEVLQGVFSKDFFGKMPDIEFLKNELSNLLSSMRDYEDMLDITRRFAREKRFHAGIHILKALTPLTRVSQYLSDIAETCITCMLPHIEREFARTHGTLKTGRFAILALGSFAARRLSVNSDLDIVAVFDVGAKEKASNGAKPLPPNLYYIRLMQRVLTALNAPTSEGILYEADTRLRPDGHDGPLAVSLEAFLTYHKTKAWTWEHMSLISSRAISPDADLKKEIESGIKDIITQKRDPEKLQRDVRDMHQKIKKQFGTKDAWNMKYRDGGMMDTLFIAHYLTLLHAHQHKTLAHPDVAQCLENIVKKKLLTKAVGEKLVKNYNLAHGVQNFLRLAAELPFDPKTASEGLKIALSRSVKVKNFRMLETQLRSLTSKEVKSII